MASREEEKRLRRAEREKAQAAAASNQSRAKRLQFLLGGLLTIAVVVGVVLLVTGGKDKGGSGGQAKTPSTETTAAATIPAPSERDLDKAAKAAGCTLVNPPIEGSSHVEGKVKYKSNPPTSGNHNATPALDGIYETGQEPEPENWVHSLEHGRINVMYKKGSPAKLVSQLETLVSEPLNGKDGYKTLLFQNDTAMPFAVAAAAWGHYIGCKTTSDGMFDALRDFRTKYVDQGPEPGIPPTN